MPLITQNPKPRVILGLMTFGPDTSKGARVTSLDDFNSCLDLFQSQGYNEVDTARVYIGGGQEAFTRSAHWKERGLQLATKCQYPAAAATHTAEKINASIATSLADLGADCVDIFYLHAADRTVPFADALQALDKLHKAGKFVQLGLSNHTAFEVAEIVMTCKAHGWVRPTVYQGMYNAITRSLESELIPACHRYGLDVVVYNPLAGGLFSGKYTAAGKEGVPSEGRFSDAGGTGAGYRARYFKDATFEALRVIEPVVAAHGLTMLETGFRWCVHHSALNVGARGGDGIIIGVSSRAQLEQNLADLEKGPLPDEVVKALDEAWLITKPTTPNYWHLDLKYTDANKDAVFKA